MLSWVLSAFYIGQTGAIFVVGISILLLAHKQRYFELLLGFFFILLLSDNLDERLYFAKSFKNFYIVLIGITLISRRDDFKPFSGIFKLFIPFFIVAIFALQFSGSIGVAIQKTVSYGLLFITIPNYLKYFYRQSGPNFLKDMICFLFVLVVAGYLLKFINLNFVYIDGTRMRGLFGNPNGLGIFLFLFFSFFHIVNSFYPEMFTRLEKRIIYIVILFALVLCGSRTAFICILIFILLERIHAISPFIGLLVLTTIVFSYEAIMSNIIVLIKQFGLEKYFRLNTLEEGSGRFIAWAFAWQKIQNFYFFGGGMGNDEFIMRKNYGILTKLGHQGGVHNSYLTLWFDVGIVGLLAYLRSLILIFIKASKKTAVAIPFLYAVLFSTTYESWIAGSLNPFTIVLLFSLTLLFEDEFCPVTSETLPDEQLILENDLYAKQEGKKKKLV